MPQAPARRCSHPGCRSLVHAAYRCPQHQKQQVEQYDRFRGTAASRGYDSTWRRIRNRHIKEEPLCRSCVGAGRTRLATMVDHIIPLGQGGTHAADNLQSLCSRCHAVKTAKDGSRTDA